MRYCDIPNRASGHLSDLAGLSRCVNEEVPDLREEVLSTSMFEEIVGSSEAISGVAGQVMRVAPSGATVLITGESGTGKELIARAIHKRSQRSASPFTKMNCAASPPSLHRVMGRLRVRMELPGGSGFHELPWNLGSRVSGSINIVREALSNLLRVRGNLEANWHFIRD
jgi:hypothetical protein